MDPTYLAFYRFFGLSENPFNVNPDPDYLFLNQRTQNILGDLIGAIQARKGLMVITGDVGTGKTTLLNYLMQWLQRQKTTTAFIFNPRLQVSELFDLMLASFSVPGTPNGSPLLRLNQWLLERSRSGANAVLIIDESQGLPTHVIEEIRMLLNQETPNEKLLQIVLCGQSEFEASLSRPELRQIRQRISLRCKMMALSLEETHGYIQRRLRRAGAPNALIFRHEAIDAVHLYSRGIPRVMNLLCEHALMRAYLENIRPVSAYLIEEVARQLQLEDAKPSGEPLVSFIGAKESKEASNEGGTYMPVLMSRVATDASDPSTMEELALAARDFAEEASISQSDAPGLGTDSNRRLQIVGPPLHDAKLSAKLVEIPLDAVRKPHSGLVEERTGQTTQAPSRKEKKKTVATPREGHGSLDWTRRVVGALRECSAQLHPIRSEIYRWSSSAREHLVVSAWENYAESLLRWLQEPMSTVKVHRRIRH